MKKIKKKKNIIKDARNLFRLERKIYGTTIKDTRNLFRLKKENETIEDRMIREIRNQFEHEEENYNISVRVGNF